MSLLMSFAVILITFAAYGAGLDLACKRWPRFAAFVEDLLTGGPK